MDYLGFKLQDPQLINEATRNQLLVKSRKGAAYKDPKKGNRWTAKSKQKVANTVKDYNKIDMNTFWKKDELVFKVQVEGETNTYFVTIQFNNILDRIKSNIRENKNKLEIKCVYNALFQALNSSDVKIDCSCLFPGTHISLLDGTKPTIEDLLVRYEKGEDLWTYSVDTNGDFKPGHIEKVWVTKTATKGIRITLDNGIQISTTSDHLYLTRLGKYKPAECLEIGESLMPLYIKEGKNGYDLIKVNSTNRYNSIYKLVANTTKNSEIETTKKYVEKHPNTHVKYDIAIHHIDFNKHNNNPTNLKIMTGDDHWNYHNELKFENKPKAIQEHIQEKSRQTAIRRNNNPTARMLECRDAFIKKGHDSAKIRNHDPEHLKIQAELMSKTIKEYWDNLSDTEREAKSARISAKSKKAWKSGAFNTEKFTAARKECGHRQFTNPENQRNMQLGKMKKTLVYMIKNNIELTEENFNNIKQRTCPKISKFFSSIGEATAYFELNHKITNIEIFEVAETPVYDIKVADWNNFLVEDSVILHNCPDFQYRFRVWATKNGYNAGKSENREAKITNPKDNLGAGCKHMLCVLNNAEWLQKIASVINNYINYCKDNMEYNYSRFIFPKLYGMSYDKAIQMTLFDYDDQGNIKDTLDSDEEIINLSNALGKLRGRIKKGSNKNPVAQKERENSKKK